MDRLYSVNKIGAALTVGQPAPQQEPSTPAHPSPEPAPPPRTTQHMNTNTARGWPNAHKQSPLTSLEWMSGIDTTNDHRYPHPRPQ